ncbi:hypothetical protein M8818_000348 [Zalaria obscura]|uniref:Uncharacterized protein n=1 Tax=Zalaria obscura TaxID=2024903 RepID=A0ACC3SR87_9PEZI
MQTPKESGGIGNSMLSLSQPHAVRMDGLTAAGLARPSTGSLQLHPRISSCQLVHGRCSASHTDVSMKTGSIETNLAMIVPPVM